jgi:hypothetical protein
MANSSTVSGVRWQDIGNFILGAWLFISPWVLGFNGSDMVARNAWLFGVIVALLAALAIFVYQQWEEWVSAAIGVWIFISPWVLSASTNANVLWNSLIVGALMVILALWSVSLEHGSGRLAAGS